MKATIAILVFGFSLLSINAEPVNTTYFGNKALHGYDPVAYFHGGPREGKDAFRLEWGGATWLFSSADNLKLFKQSPQKYMPRYGGYCAYAMSKGEYADVNPLNYKIVDGRLYLNYDSEIQKKWEANQKSFIESADREWIQKSR